MPIPPPSHPSEAERLAVLHRCGILDTATEQVFDDLTRLAASIAGTPIALVSLVDAERQWFKSAFGLGASQTPREHAFCAHAILDDTRPLVVEDASQDERFRGNPLVTGEPHVIFYAGVPLRVGPAGMPLGTLCVIDHQPRRLTEAVLEQLALLGRQVEHLLALRYERQLLEDQVVSATLQADRLALLDKVAAQVPGMVYQFLVKADGSASFPYCSEGIRQVYGISPAEAARSAQPVIDRLHPADHDQVMESIRHSAEQLTLWTSEYRYRHPDGRICWLHGQASPERLADGAVLWHGFITDISKRKQLHQEMEGQEARFRLLVEGATDIGIFMLDVEGHVKSWNPGAEYIKGYRANEIIGRHFSCFYRPEDRGMCGQALATARTSLRYESIGWRLRKDGSEFWAHVIITPIIDHEGVLLGFTKISRDISDRLHAERNAALLSAVIGAADVAIIATSPAGIITVFNPGAERMLGYTADEMVGKFAPVVIHDPAEVVARAAELSLETGSAIAPGFEVLVWIPTHRRQTDEREWTYVRKDGRRLPVRISVTALRAADGAINGYLGIALDISVQQRQLQELEQAKLQLESERQRLALALASGNVGTWDWDVVNNHLTWDERMYVLYATTSGEFTRAYEAWSSRIHPEDRARAEAEISAALAGERAFDSTFRLRLPDGAVRHIHGCANVFRTADGTAFRMIGTNWDVTREREQNEELRGAMELAQAGAKAKADFLATMSHEIRTPMNGVIGLTDLLLKTGLDGEQRDLVETLRSCGESLLVLINDILDVSKFESGRVTLEAIPFSATRLIEDALLLYQGQAEQKGINLDFSIVGPHPPLVLGDPTRVRQVLLNLVSNAIKFTQRGAVAITLAATQTNEGAMTLEFAVRDTGVGMTPKQIAVLGEAFTQADVSTTRRFGGTGLGITISKAILSLMRSGIEVTSTPGAGSTFRFCLTLPAGGDDIVSKPRLLRDVAVCCVEDDAAERDQLVAMCRSWGMTVEAFASAQDLMLHLGQRVAPPAVLVVDHELPGIDGVMLTRMLHATAQPAPPLVLLSGMPERARVELKNTVGLAVVRKPLQASRLLTAIHSLLGDGSAVRPAAAPAELRLRRVLLVEDTLINQRVMQALLKPFCESVTLAVNGLAAVAAVEAGTAFDLVLMDCQMPEMDGYEATRLIRIREQRLGLPRVPIIALTAHALQGSRETCLAAGMDDYLSKPIREFDLVNLLAKRFAGSPELSTEPTESAVQKAPPQVSPHRIRLAELQDELGKTGFISVIEAVGTELPQQVERLVQAISVINRTRIKELGHSLRGSGAALGMPDLQRIGGTYERQAATMTTEQMQLLRQELIREVEAILAAVAEFAAVG